MLRFMILLTGIFAAVTCAAAPLDFNRDIRPILSENCLHCHGRDAAARQAELRLDQRESAVESGAIVPGDVTASSLVERITQADPDLRMPPADSSRQLSAIQIERLTQWIREGAYYDRHWAFKPIDRPTPPASNDSSWPRGEIDRFVLQTLRQNELAPSKRAPLPILLRRISFDVVGLPPTPEQLEGWQAVGDPVAAALDELLASPHYGERMATDWLDVARYADTHGFNNDSLRTMWRWRDWVIAAFNKNLPYDQFITEQLAGDLLPNATLEQRIATGFNRNHVINSEGGIIDEEYRVEYVADRVRTTSLAWMGITIECARCHDHKFDPFSQREYYQLFAFFNSFDETGEDGRVANASPLMAAPTLEQVAQANRMRDEEEALLTHLKELLAEKPATVPPAAVFSWKDWAGDRLAWEATTEAYFPAGDDVSYPNAKVNFNEGWTFAGWVKRDTTQSAPLFSTMNMLPPRSSQGHGHGVQVRVSDVGALELRVAARWPAYSLNVVSSEVLPLEKWVHVCVSTVGTTATGVRMFVDGMEVETQTIHEDLTHRVVPEGIVMIGRSNSAAEPAFTGSMRGVRLIGKPVDEQLEEILEAEVAANRQEPVFTSAQQFADDPKLAKLYAKWKTARCERLAYLRSFPTVMVAQELPQPRPTHILERGQYDAPRDLVEPDVPNALGLPLRNDMPRNRLALAKWITDPRNPLTARVVVNRLWMSFFGVGIVKTVEDFGTQSDMPSHPEMLDWLASELIASGWSLPHVIRLIVNSATYQQDSAATAQLWARDPENRLLARGPRQRLTAEMIRDQALAASGLLTRRIGGPPVYPFQPPDLYQGIIVDAAYPGTKYELSTGEDLYRRSLYTFWKRTVPHPTLSAFDAPDREFCTGRRFVTNTPLQALTLMNDPTFLEPARQLGQRMLRDGGEDDRARIIWGFELVACRKPLPSEVDQLSKLLREQREEFASGRSNPASVLDVGSSPRSELLDRVELAAYASVASLLFNLDEVLTRN